MEWVQLAVTLAVALFGGGAAAQFFRLRHDKRLGIRNQDLAEDTAAEEWWQNRLKAQADLLVEPLRRELGEQRDEVRDLRNEVRDLRAEVSHVRTRYWRAINLIRALYAWIDRYGYDVGVERPQPHPDISQDI